MKKHILKENYERFFEKREFGDPLPTFEDVMKKHQVNKFKEDLDSVDKEDDDVDNDGDSDASDDYLKNRRDVISKAIETESIKEGWWDNMSDAAKKSYIKKHGSAPNVAGDDDYDMGEVPGSRDTGPWTPEDDPDFEHGPSLTSAPGRVPDEDDLSTSPEKDYEPWDSFADRDAEMTPDDLKKIQALGEPSGDEDDYDMGAPDRVPNQDFRSDPTDDDYSVYDDPEIARIPDEESSGRTGNELNQETLMIDGKQYNRITEGKIDSKFIKYRVYDKISDEIDKVEPDDFNLRDFNSLKKPLIKFIQREVSKDKKIDTGDLRKAIDKSDFDDKVFGRGGIIDGWYKKSERDFPKFLKRNSNLKWKNYNASSLTYGIGKPLYKIVDSLLDGINSLVPESKYPFSEFYERFKK
jgi:hypothetical protein